MENKEIVQTEIDDNIMESNWDGVVTTFDELELKENLLRGIISLKFRYFRLWVRDPLSHSTKSHCSYCPRKRCHRPSSIWIR